MDWVTVGICNFYSLYILSVGNDDWFYFLVWGYLGIFFNRITFLMDHFINIDTTWPYSSTVCLCICR